MSQMLLVPNDNGDPCFSPYMTMDLRLLRKLLDLAPGLIDMVNLGGQTLMHRLACNSMQPGMEEVFLEVLRLRPGMLTQRDNEGNTPIHQAISYCAIGVARLLIGLATPNDLLTLNNDGDSLIKHSMYYGQTKLISTLLNKQPELIHCISRNGENLLHDLVAMRHANDSLKLLDLLLSLKPELVYGVNKDGDTPLHKVADPVFVPFIEKALRADPELATKRNFRQQTIIFPHTIHSETIMACMLRLHPELIKTVDDKGDTILHQLMIDYHPKYSLFQLILNTAREQDFDIINAKNTQGLTVLQAFNLDTICRGYDRSFNCMRMFEEIFENTKLASKKDLFVEVGERWSKRSFWKKFVCTSGRQPERVLQVILKRFPDIITEEAIKPAVDEGCYHFLKTLARLYPHLAGDFTERLCTKVKEGAFYAGQDLATFVINIAPPDTLFHVLLSRSTSNVDRYHTIFLDFFCLKFSNARVPNIEQKQYSLLKTYQAFRNTGMGRAVIEKHFKKRGHHNLDETITKYINNNFFLYYLVCKNFNPDNLFNSLLNFACADIIGRIVTFLGPLSLWNLKEEKLPSLYSEFARPTSTLHHHPLTEEDYYNPQSFVCDGNPDGRQCEIVTGRRYKCYECNFNLCPACNQANRVPVLYNYGGFHGGRGGEEEQEEPVLDVRGLFGEGASDSDADGDGLEALFGGTCEPTRPDPTLFTPTNAVEEDLKGLFGDSSEESLPAIFDLPVKEEQKKGEETKTDGMDEGKPDIPFEVIDNPMWAGEERAPTEISDLMKFF